MNHCLNANLSKIFYKPFFLKINLEHFQRHFFQTPYLWQCYLRQSMLLEYSHPKGIFVCPTQPMLPVLYPWHMLRPLHNPVIEHTYYDLHCRSIRNEPPKVLRPQYYTKDTENWNITLALLPCVSLMLTYKIPYVHSILLLSCQKKQILLEEAKN